ncbi:MAG: hypothetical protein ACI38Y_05300 [Candidatus Methanomethylophilaceae archaeon]
MITDKVLTKNRMVAVVTVIAVAACLLFAYLTLDTGGSERRAEAVGDHVHMGVWNDDIYYDIDYILASVDGEESVYIRNVYGGEPSTITTVNGFLEDLCYFDPEDLEPVGEDLVVTIAGDHICDVYKTEFGTFYVDDGIIIKSVTPVGTSVLYTTSLTDPEPPVEDGMRMTLEGYDYIALRNTGDYGSIVTVIVIDSVEDDSADITFVTYKMDTEGETTISRNSGDMSIEGFWNFMLFDQEHYLGDGWTTDGTVVCLDTPMGNVLCNIYTNNGGTMWVGVNDSVIYSISYPDGNTLDIIGTSLLDDHATEFDSSPAQDIGVDSVWTASVVSYKLGINGLEDFRASAMTAEIVSIDGDNATVVLTSMPDLETTEIVQSISDFSKIWDLNGIDGIGKVEVVDTPMGNRLCITCESDILGSTLEQVVDCFNDIGYSLTMGWNGEYKQFDLAACSEVTGDRDRNDTSAGDVLLYDTVRTDGSEHTALLVTFDIVGTMYMETDEDDTAYWGPVDDMGKPQRHETIDTVYGGIECVVYVDEYYDGETIISWIADGYAYPLRMDIVTEDGTERLDIRYMSFI